MLLGICDEVHLLEDPCQPRYHTVHLDSQGVFSVGSVTDRNNAKCWRRIRETWYRIKSGNHTVDADIATKCVELFHCGTIYPIWIKG